MDSPIDDLDLPPVNIWNRDGTLHSRRPYKGLDRANTLPTRKTAPRTTERTVRFSLDDQRAPSPDPFGNTSLFLPFLALSLQQKLI